MSTYSIEVNSNHIASAKHFTADRDIRYYLNGVCIEATATETRVVATDGHAAAVHRQQAKNVIGDESVISLIVPNDTVAALMKVLPKKGCLIDFILSEGQWHIATPYARISFEPIDGRFPDYRAVIPSVTSGEVCQLDPELMIRFVKAAKALGIKQYPLVQHNGTSAALVTLCSTEDFVGVVMPLNPAKIHYVPTTWACHPGAAS